MKKQGFSFILYFMGLILLSSVVRAEPFVRAENEGIAAWKQWFLSQLESHPSMSAMRAQLISTNANAEAAEQPLYNPELSSEFERNGEDNNYTLGVQQTFDWWDRRAVKQQQAGFIRQAAEAQYRQQLLEKTANALSALVEWRANDRAASIAESQKAQLNTLLALAEKRQKAGDIGSIDAELAFLSLSQQLAQVAETEVALRKAESRVRELLPEWTARQGGVPEALWPSDPAEVSENDLLAHPLVASARAQWQSLQEEAEVIRLTAKAEPTVGVNAGRDTGENLIGLTFSMPLNVRNNFSAETRAASSAALEQEARYQAVYRKQRFNWQSAQMAWKRYQEQHLHWQTLVQGRVNNSAELLERQWRSGDLSTTDYLQALNQRTDSLLAGIQLEKQTRLALTDMLLQSGSLLTQLVSTAKSKPTN